MTIENARVEALKLAWAPDYTTEEVLERAEKFYQFLLGPQSAPSNNKNPLRDLAA